MGWPGEQTAVEGRLGTSVTHSRYPGGDGDEGCRERGLGAAGFADPGGHTDSSLCVAVGPRRTRSMGTFIFYLLIHSDSDQLWASHSHGDRDRMCRAQVA